MNDMKIWTLDGYKATPLEVIAEMESEWDLEETLVSNPDLLMDGLTLVGRQTPTEGGPLDLLGVDADGRLCVFELKRGSLPREAVAQVIDYASDLDSMNWKALSGLISDKSGSGGIEKIKDFDMWYSQNHGDWDNLKPLRLFLVGLGADDTTERMVKFIAANGVDISLITFQGFAHAGKTLLAKSVEVGGGAASERARTSRRQNIGQRWTNLLQVARDYGVRELFDSVVEMFRETWGDWRREDPLLGSLRIDLHEAGVDVGERPYVRVDFGEKEVWVNFHQRAFTLCEDEFNHAIDSMEYPSSHEIDKTATEIRFPLTADYWECHKETLTALAKAVYESWMESGE